MRAYKLVMAALALAACSVGLPAMCGGALSFFATATPVQTGTIESWMNNYADCPLQPCQAGINGVALPTKTAPATVTTQNDGINLVFGFTITDVTHKKEGSLSTLDVGDKIIIQIDPAQTPALTLSTSQPFYRFEITIKDERIVTATRRTPSSATAWGFPGSNWCTPPTSPPAPLPQVCNAADGSVVTLSSSSPDYVLEIKIPLSTINSPTGQFGLAMAIVNDLGHDDAMGQHDLAIVTFPMGDMPAANNPYLDPGVLPTAPAGGPWVKPVNWGRGLLQPAPVTTASLTMDRTPNAYFARAIKLSFCDVARWEDIGEATTAFQQWLLGNWYLYENADPCKMGIWVKVHNSQAASTARLLVLWADGGLGQNTWRVVGLTPPISFGAGDSTFRVVWDKVPSNGSAAGGSTHPCLRVYIVPATISNSDPSTAIVYDAARINAINSEAAVAGFERAYGFPSGHPWNAQVAQMNFNNLAQPNTSCSRLPLCKQPTIVTQYGGSILASLVPPAYAQPPTHGDILTATPVDPRAREKPPGLKYPAYFVHVQGFIVPEKPPQSRSRYLIVEGLAGQGWAIPASVLASGKPIDLTIVVGNPAVWYRDFGGKKVREIKAPVRRVVIAATTQSPRDGKKLNIRTQEIKPLRPGEATRIRIRIGTGAL